MYYLIVKSGVIVGKSKKEIESHPKVKGKLDFDEMKAYGPDYVINMTDADIDFIQDKRKLSMIMFQNFFRKDNSVKVFCIVNVFMAFLNIILINNVGKGVTEVINAVTQLMTALGNGV